MPRGHSRINSEAPGPSERARETERVLLNLMELAERARASVEHGSRVQSDTEYQLSLPVTKDFPPYGFPKFPHPRQLYGSDIYDGRQPESPVIAVHRKRPVL